MGNVHVLIGGKNTSRSEYGHTQSFTEQSLPALISKSLRIVEVTWHDQDVFISAVKWKAPSKTVSSVFSRSL